MRALQINGEMRPCESCFAGGCTIDTPALGHQLAQLGDRNGTFTMHNEAQSEKIREMNDIGYAIHVEKFTHGFRYTEMLRPLPAALRTFLNGTSGLLSFACKTSSKSAVVFDFSRSWGLSDLSTRFN